jgi:hypothetical protein
VTKLIICVDRETGRISTLEVGPTSPWHELLPEVQVASFDAMERREALPDPVIVRS